jgi:hypothetical protein
MQAGFFLPRITMPNYLSPVFNDQTIDAAGNPLVNGRVETYIAGTSTPLASFTTQNGTTQQANPIILNSRGEATNPIWLGAGQLYKFILKDAAGVTLRTIDNVGGVNDASLSVSEWNSSGFAPTFISSTSFSVAGDQTGTFTAARRVRSTNTSGTVYSTITSSSYSVGTGLTTVNVVNDSTPLDSGLSAVDVGILNPAFRSFPSNILTDSTRIDVASAATVNLTTSAPLTRNIRITGTTPITAFTIAAGQNYFVSFSGALTLTNNANIVTNTGANITTAAGDSCIIRATAANVVEVISYEYVVQPVASGGTGSTTGPLLRGYIDGLTMSTAGASATMTIDAGQATNSTNAALLTLSASINKTTAAWAVGSGNGGIDTGSIANSTWYYFYLIRRPDTGVVDVVFSLNSASPTLPTNYTQFRYIGAGLTNGSAQWTAFTQFGDYFQWGTPVVDFTGAGVVTASTLTCSVPRGRKMLASFNVTASQGASAAIYLSDLASVDLAPGTTAAPLSSMRPGDGAGTGGSMVSVTTNTSAQIRRREGATGTYSIAAVGWTDLRGRNA